MKMQNLTVPEANMMTLIGALMIAFALTFRIVFSTARGRVAAPGEPTNSSLVRYALGFVTVAVLLLPINDTGITAWQAVLSYVR